jgi:hypothetical protein
MARLLIADVTLLKGSELRAQVRFKGGATRTLMLPSPKPYWMVQQTPAMIVAEIDRLLDEHTDAEIAASLNKQGMVSGAGKRFSRLMVARIRTSYHLESRYSRLRARGLLSLPEIARRLDVAPDTVKIWRRAGLLKAHRFDDRGQCLFEAPDRDAPAKYRHQQKSLGKSKLWRETVSPPDR